MPKAIQELTTKETLEDLGYHLSKLQIMVPPFCDNRLNHIIRLYKHLEKLL